MDNYFYYFAYGSNMLTERLIQRCPSTKAVGVAFVDDYALEFSKKSTDGSGKATIVESPGQRQYGVVFTIEECDRDSLDDAEGLGTGYDKDKKFNVTMVDSGAYISTMTYIATNDPEHTHLKPYDWYLALVVAGAMEHKLPKSVVTVYRNTECDDDEDQERKCNKLEILKDAILGDNWQVLGT